MSDKKKIMAGCISDCVHVAGFERFLQIAKEMGYDTLSLGPAQSVDSIIAAIKKEDPEIVGVSYRLTPENGIKYVEEFKRQVKQEGLSNRFVLGSLPATASYFKEDNFFERIFVGDEVSDVVSYLREQDLYGKTQAKPAQDLVGRIDQSKPFPIFRSHFGLPSFERTREGIEKLAQSGLIDVISLGTDQYTQSHFYNQEAIPADSRGAGGVPIRTEEDFRLLFETAQQGNFPLIRTYAGTDDLLKLAEMYSRNINNAWSAVPIFWFNKMDGRGPMDLESSIKSHLDLIKYNADNGIPVEVLEAHHWSMRDAPDEVAITSAYLGAFISKKLGVQNFVSQYMFNTPPLTSGVNDLAKMLAQKELIESLADNNFNVYTQTRAGLFSFPVNEDMAKGQLVSSTMLQMQLDPDIIHVVSYSEADHAATPEDIIASLNMVRQVVKNSQYGLPDMSIDPTVKKRKDELTENAKRILSVIDRRYALDTLHDNPEKLAGIVYDGVFDAPQLSSSKIALGRVETRMDSGACVSDSYLEVIESDLDTLRRDMRIGFLTDIPLSVGKEPKVDEKYDNVIYTLDAIASHGLPGIYMLTSPQIMLSGSSPIGKAHFLESTGKTSDRNSLVTHEMAPVSIEDLDVLLIRGDDIEKNPDLVSILDQVNNVYFPIDVRDMLATKDKLETARRCEDLSMLKSYQAKDYQDLKYVFKELSEQGNRYAVLKYRFGFGGKEVERVDLNDPHFMDFANSFLDTYKDVVVQQYDPTVSEGDIRVILYDGKYVGAFERKPGEGQWKSNISLGGTAVAHLPLPGEIEVAEAVASKFPGLKYMGLDMFPSLNLIEVNGFCGGMEEIDIFYDKNIADWLISDMLRYKSIKL